MFILVSINGRNQFNVVNARLCQFYSRSRPFYRPYFALFSADLISRILFSAAIFDFSNINKYSPIILRNWKKTFPGISRLLCYETQEEVLWGVSLVGDISTLTPPLIRCENCEFIRSPKTRVFFLRELFLFK